MIYRIKDWNKLYETPESRKLKHVRWVIVRNDLDDIGYVRLIDHPDGAAHCGAWVVFLEIASKGTPRGTLTCRGEALTCEDISRISRIPRKICEDAMERLCSSEIGWVETLSDSKQETAGKSPEVYGKSPEAPAESPGRREGKGREGKGTDTESVVVVAACGNVENSVEIAESLPTDSNAEWPSLDDIRADEDLTQWVRDALLDYTAKIPGWNLPPPDDALCQQILALVGKQHAAIIGQVLKELYQKGKRPAESWGWFPAVIQDYLKPRAVAR